MLNHWIGKCSRTNSRLLLLEEGKLDAHGLAELRRHALTCPRCRRQILAASRLIRTLREGFRNTDEEFKPTAHCPDTEVLAGFAAGQLMEDERRRWLGHVASCPACVSEISRLKTMLNCWPEPNSALAQLAEELVAAGPPERRPVRVWKVGLAIAAAAALLVAVLVQRHQGPRSTQPAPAGIAATPPATTTGPAPRPPVAAVPPPTSMTSPRAAHSTPTRPRQTVRRPEVTSRAHAGKRQVPPEPAPQVNPFPQPDALLSLTGSGARRKELLAGRAAPAAETNPFPEGHVNTLLPGQLLQITGKAKPPVHSGAPPDQQTPAEPR